MSLCRAVCSCAPTWRPKCWAGTSHSLSRGTFQHILPCKSYTQGSTLNRSVLPLLHTSQLIILRAIHPAMHYCTSRTVIAPPDLCPAAAICCRCGTDFTKCRVYVFIRGRRGGTIQDLSENPALQTPHSKRVTGLWSPSSIHIGYIMWDIFSSQPRLVFKGVKCNFCYNPGCKRNTQKHSHC